MGADGDVDGPRKRRKLNPPETGPYVLRQLVDQIPVSAEGDQGAHITCVEYWNDNLYVGTSLGEVLHFVSLPGDGPNSDTTDPTLILASRLPVSASINTATPDVPVGVQRILVVPRANKACILCDGVVSFYSLPELSPAYGTTKVGNCSWIGGLDLNESAGDDEGRDPVVMIARQNNLMLVRMGEEPRRVKNIEFPGCLAGVRRDTIGCVADGFSYSLLDVERRQKIHLSKIRPSEEQEDPELQNIPKRPGISTHRHSASSNGNELLNENRIHGRSSSLNAVDAQFDTRRRSPESRALPRSLSRTPDPDARASPNRQLTTHGSSDTPSNGSTMPPLTQKALPRPPASELSTFKPHVVSPTPSEFLFVTGTEESGVGVGMFVNLDGEGTRGTIEFQTYPDAIVLDNDSDGTGSAANNDSEEGYILAVVDSNNGEELDKQIEAQRWDLNPGEGERHKSLLAIPLCESSPGPIGIHRTVSSTQVSFSRVGDIMRMVRLKLSSRPENADPRTKASIEQLQKEKELFESQEIDPSTIDQPSSGFQPEWEVQRSQEEAKLAMNLAHVNSGVLLWGGNCIWRVVRNPLALQLENSLQLAQPELDDGLQTTDLTAITQLLDEMATIIPKTENEFRGLNYVMQKASLVLFAHLISTDQAFHTTEMIKATELALINGGLDPRVLLLLIPLVKSEVLESSQGIWVNRGLAMVAEPLIETSENGDMNEKTFQDIDVRILMMTVRFLLSWQKKRGYGSIADEMYVFNSVDAALLHLLLELDSSHYRKANAPAASFARTELNRLVDNWKGDFERAIELLEDYRRLFVLSRLYQSQKMSKHVLGTWKRMIEGDTDAGGELSTPAAEIQVRKYLVKLRDSKVVEEYGTWLASRNPTLGIQVFADDTSRIKLDPVQVIPLLKENAPGAVQVYLEHLVFAKNCSQYADDLIGYYLDTVISVLENSPEARTSLAESYSTYRALRPPKPSYLGFISENAPPNNWWQSRLRLLQLLGGESRSQFTSTPTPRDLSYSITAVLKRIEPFQNELVSESIILGGRQGRHHEALHLLTHGLGDYDTAIRYCVYGGFSASPTSTPPVTEESLKFRKDLFTRLLREFLEIPDSSDRIERTSDLLTRFAALYDVGDVLSVVPDDWTVDVLSGFLVRVLRDLLTEKREVKVQRALSAGLNLKVGVEMLEKGDKTGGGWVEEESGVRALNSGKSKDIKGKKRAIVDENERR
ncbi:hypothetical protein LOZ53_006669 [Ophidiomyces ophidiicola]|nr:hypothetical protein LOZ53_006669 [Ophidiomyces ophidiicola]